MKVYQLKCLMLKNISTNKMILLRLFGPMSRVFTNGPRDWGSIPGWVIPKTQKMVLDAILLNTQHYNVWIKGKVK